MKILSLIALLFAFFATGSAAAQQTWTVGPGEEVTRITEAIERAAPGDTLVIKSGTYREGPIEVDKRLAIVGEGAPVLDGELQHPVLRVTADSASVEGLTIRDVGRSHTRDHAAIRFEDARHGRIAGNRIENGFFGIYVARSRHIEVLDNEVIGEAERESSSGNGIHLWKSDSIRVERNTVRSHRDGIYIEFAGSSAFNDNRSEDNLRYGLHFMFSDGNRYARNTFRRNGAGAAVMYSSDISMTENDFSHNWGVSIYGLLLKDISDSVIEDNRFYRNTTGIYSEGSSRTRIEGNTFERNGWAVRILSNTYDNTFTRNNFVGNTFDVTTNTRRNPNTFDENYWARYDGYDLTGDGIGDVPHRPVRLFALVVERQPATLALLGSIFVDLLDLAERVLPVLTPEALIDERPLMGEVRREDTETRERRDAGISEEREVWVAEDDEDGSVKNE